MDKARTEKPHTSEKLDRSTQAKMNTLFNLLKCLENKTNKQAKQDEWELQRICFAIRRSLERREKMPIHEKNPMEGIPCGCHVCTVKQEVDQLYHSATAPNDSLHRGTRSSANDRLELIMDKLVTINLALDRGMRDAKVQRMGERYEVDLGIVMAPDEEVCCKVCNDERARQINTFILVDRWSIREVERWTVDTGARIPRSTLMDHIERHLRSNECKRASR